MTDKDLWTTFEKTGRIVDYLQYKSQCSGEYQTSFSDRKMEMGDKVGEDKLESDGNSNRHDTVRGTYRGI